jgi:hypothetical protein
MLHEYAVPRGLVALRPGLGEEDGRRGDPGHPGRRLGQEVSGARAGGTFPACGGHATRPEVARLALLDVTDDATAHAGPDSGLPGADRCTRQSPRVMPSPSSQTRQCLPARPRVGRARRRTALPHCLRSVPDAERSSTQIGGSDSASPACQASRPRAPATARGAPRPAPRPGPSQWALASAAGTPSHMDCGCRWCGTCRSPCTRGRGCLLRLSCPRTRSPLSSKGNDWPVVRDGRGEGRESQDDGRAPEASHRNPLEAAPAVSAITCSVSRSRRCRGAGR